MTKFYGKNWIEFRADFFDRPEVKEMSSKDRGEILIITYLKLKSFANLGDGSLRVKGLKTVVLQWLGVQIEEAERDIEQVISILANRGLINLEISFLENGTYWDLELAFD